MSTGEERTFSSRQRAEVVSGPIAAAAAIGATAAQPELQTELQPLVEPLRRDLGARIYNVRDFAAKGDGKLLDSAAVQAAIDACAGEHGGTVLVPAGTFLIGPIELKNNVTLHIAAGGTLLGAADAALYHPARGIPLEGDHTMSDVLQQYPSHFRRRGHGSGRCHAHAARDRFRVIGCQGPLAHDSRIRPVFYSMFLYVVVLYRFMATQLGLGTMRLWEVRM